MMHWYFRVVPHAKSIHGRPVRTRAEHGDAIAAIPGNRRGFSLVEVIIALLILAIGVLAMAATTGYLSRQIRQADLRTERAIAVRTATERLRTIKYNDLDGRSAADAWEIGDYLIYWDVTNNGSWKLVTMFSEGPGLDAGGQVTATGKDTTVFSVAQTAWN